MTVKYCRSLLRIHFLSSINHRKMFSLKRECIIRPHKYHLLITKPLSKSPGDSHIYITDAKMKMDISQIKKTHAQVGNFRGREFGEKRTSIN